MSTSVITRRSLLLGSGAILAGSQMGGIAETPTHEMYNVVLEAPGSERYAEGIAKHYRPLVADAVFEALSSATVLIRNAGRAGVRALTITWKIVGAETYQFSRSYWFAPRFVRSGSPKIPTSGEYAYYLGAVQLIYPQKIRLFSPFFSIAPSYVADQLPAWKKILFRKPSSEFILSRLKNAKTISGAIDAAIFAGNKVIGQDTHGLVLQYTLRRKAQVALAKKIKSQFDSGLDTSAIASNLLREASLFSMARQKQAVDLSDPEHFTFLSEWSHQAKVLLLRLGNGKESLHGTVSYLSSKTVKPITKLT